MTTPMIDTHCHLNFNRYDDDRDDIVQGAHTAGVTRIIIPAIDTDTCQQAIDLTQRYAGVYAAVGVHPNSTADFDTQMLAQIRAFADHDQVIAIGEIGLDYYWDKSPKATQADAFKRQLELASELERPVIIHNRDAGEDVMNILEAWVADLPASFKDRPGVMHSFLASQAIADRALQAGFYLGFTGPVTFKNADDLRAIVRGVPLDRILVETDGPFLTPEPYRGKRNKPEYIPHIVDRIASLKQISTDEMAAASTANAVRLFHL
jgi:TatD DNase family protein